MNSVFVLWDRTTKDIVVISDSLRDVQNWFKPLLNWVAQETIDGCVPDEWVSRGGTYQITEWNIFH